MNWYTIIVVAVFSAIICGPLLAAIIATWCRQVELALCLSGFTVLCGSAALYAAHEAAWYEYTSHTGSWEGTYEDIHADWPAYVPPALLITLALVGFVLIAGAVALVVRHAAADSEEES